MSQKRNSRGSLKDLAWGVFLLAVGCLGTFAGVSAYLRDARIERSGQRAEGHLKRKNATLIYESISYDVDYWFVLPGGERVEGTRDVGESLWSSLREGEPFVVLYSPEDPKQNFPLGGGDASLWTIIATGMAAIAALVGGLFVFFYFFRPEMLD